MKRPTIILVKGLVPGTMRAYTINAQPLWLLFSLSGPQQHRPS
jgi:hypothetical protein